MKAKPFARLLLCLALLLPAGVLARPALWVVKHADTTIYLFGTVHLLPHDTSWRYPALEQALAKSQTLYIELTDDDQATVSALVLRYGLDPAHPLGSLLDAAQLRQVQRAVAQAGVPGGMQAVGMMRPWLAALTLTTAPLLKAGLDPQQGVDRQLQAQMLAAGKPVLGLETADQQIHLLADMPDTLQLKFLQATLKDADKDGSELTGLIDAWKDGDTGRIARIEAEDLRQQAPALYQRLLVQRNRTWAARIAAMLQQPGTTFIAVGAAHLAGPDSVQAQLRQLGIAVVRQ
ncbi:MAG: TraB/GumN family protein [Xanthomonadaceae bacterium]|nr:TraB/GumN family protein [Xanthomonadaceae bacterium]